jgi:hypothetical protein
MTRPSIRTPAQVGGQVCGLFAVDIAEFTRPDRDDDVRRFMHEELYRILEQAFDGSGIPWSACFREDRGARPGKVQIKPHTTNGPAIRSRP